jgi:hypothetical protein
MDKKTYSIGILSLTAVVLLVANFLATPRVEATQGFVNPGRDYQVVSAPEQSGGDALYVLNNRTGMLAVFTYDAAARRMVPRVVTPVATALAQSTGATGAVTAPGTTPRQR